MLFTVEDKHLIKVLREEKRYSLRRLLEEFPIINRTRGGLDYLLKKIDHCGSTARTYSRNTLIKCLPSMINSILKLRQIYIIRVQLNSLMCFTP